MKITPVNAGDVIRMDSTGSLIQIESVTDTHVNYRLETGDHHSSFDHEIAGSVVLDQNRIQEFLRNSALGSALLNAEICAIRSLLDVDLTYEQREDANSVLRTVRSMKRRLNERVPHRTEQENTKHAQNRSLDAMISRASAEAQSQTTSSHKSPSIGFDR